MTSHYFDTGLVLKLVIPEPLSDRVLGYVQQRGLVIPYSRLMEIEIENTLHALRFRKVISGRQLAGARQLVADLVGSGRFVPTEPGLDAIAREALSLVPILTPRTGCRTLDLMHVATAKLLRASMFVSMDRRQLAAARLCGLQTVNLDES